MPTASALHAQEITAQHYENSNLASSAMHGLWGCVPGSVMLSPTIPNLCDKLIFTKNLPNLALIACNRELLFIQVGIIISFSI